MTYPQEARLQPHYDNLQYDAPMNGRWIEEVMSNFICDLSRVLDLGCGIGTFCKWAARQNGNVFVHGIDYSQPRIEYAKEHNNEATVGYLCKDVNAVVAAMRSPMYSVVTLWDVLEHLERPNLVLRYAANALRPGGQILATIPVNMPYEAHLQVYRNVEELNTALRPTRVVQTHLGRDYFLCEWSKQDAGLVP